MNLMDSIIDRDAQLTEVVDYQLNKSFKAEETKRIMDQNFKELERII